MRDQFPFRPKKFRPVKVLFFLALAVLFLAIVGRVIMFLWNFTLPELINAQPINFWQALALFVLFRLLFGGFRMGGFKERARKKRRYWKDKWMKMDEGERAEFKNKWKEHCNRRKSK